MVAPGSWRSLYFQIGRDRNVTRNDLMGVGMTSVGRKRIYKDDAARVAAFRARKQLVTLSVDIPRDVAEALDRYLQFKDVTKGAVIEKLLRSQLLRKR